jgi:hypothetical protein
VGSPGGCPRRKLAKRRARQLRPKAGRDAGPSGAVGSGCGRGFCWCDCGQPWIAEIERSAPRREGPGHRFCNSLCEVGTRGDGVTSSLGRSDLLGWRYACSGSGTATFRCAAERERQRSPGPWRRSHGGAGCGWLGAVAPGGPIRERESLLRNGRWGLIPQGQRQDARWRCFGLPSTHDAAMAGHDQPDQPSPSRRRLSRALAVSVSGHGLRDTV